MFLEIFFTKTVRQARDGPEVAAAGEESGGGAARQGLQAPQPDGRPQVRASPPPHKHEMEARREYRII